MRPERTANIPWRQIDDRAVVVQPANGRVHELNETGSVLWNGADGTRTLADLARLLASSFEIAPEAARADTEAFFASLAAQGLIRWQES